MWDNVIRPSTRSVACVSSTLNPLHSAAGVARRAGPMRSKTSRRIRCEASCPGSVVSYSSQMADSCDSLESNLEAVKSARIDRVQYWIAEDADEGVPDDRAEAIDIDGPREGGVEVGRRRDYGGQVNDRVGHRLVDQPVQFCQRPGSQSRAGEPAGRGLQRFAESIGVLKLGRGRRRHGSTACRIEDNNPVLFEHPQCFA